MQFTKIKTPTVATGNQSKRSKGFWLCRDFISPQQQSSLISAILNGAFSILYWLSFYVQNHCYKSLTFLTCGFAEGWFTEASHNQAMRFGDLPSWATEISNSIYDEAKKEACPFPSDLLLREPLFDQLIVNAYQPGEVR